MTGMTPAWLTRRGRYWRWPPYVRRPRVCLACWIGMRRCAWVMRTTPRTTATNMMTIRRTVSMPIAPEAWKLWNSTVALS